MAAEILPSGRRGLCSGRSIGWGPSPFLLVALPLIIITNFILEVSPFIFILSTGTMVMATFALTALALGFGALFPNYETDNVAEIPTSFGGLLFMMAAVGYLAGVIILEAWPVYSFLSANLQGEPVRNFLFTPPRIGDRGGIDPLGRWPSCYHLRAGVRKVRALDFQ